jgi:hypothetical protein
VDRPGYWEMGTLVMGRNNRTGCDQFRHYLDYSADVSAGASVPGLDINDIANKHVKWRNYLPQMESFELQGAPSGKICGLDTNFHFVNIGFNQFSFSDKGGEWPVVGYCQLVYPGPQLSGGLDKPNAVCGLDNGERSNGWMTFETNAVFGCWVPGVDNYCRDYGSG